LDIAVLDKKWVGVLLSKQMEILKAFSEPKVNFQASLKKLGFS